MPVKPLSAFTPDEMRKYKLDYYKRNKSKVQKERIASGIINGTRTPSKATLEKYGFEVKNNKVVIPQKRKYVTTQSNTEDTSPDVINVVVNREPRIRQYNTSNILLNGKEMKDFVTTKLNTMPQKGPGTAPLSDTEISNYSKVPNVIFMLYGVEPYDPLVDLTPMVSDPLKLIEVADKKPTWGNGSKARFLARILKLARVFEPMGAVIRPNEDKYNILDDKFRVWSGTALSKQLTTSAASKFYVWDVMKDAVILHYGYETYESLMVQLYEEVIGRDDLALTMAYKPTDVTTDANYLLLNRTKKTAEVILNKYKNANSMRAVTFKLSTKLAKLIIVLKPNNKTKTLFPIEGAKLKSFITDTFKNIAFLYEKGASGIRYIRHSLISTKLMELDENSSTYHDDKAELAKKSMHALRTQQNYKSLLIDKENNIIDTRQKLEALKNVISTRSTTWWG